MSNTRQTFGCETWRAVRTSPKKLSSAALSFREILRQELERDGLIQFEVFGLIDLAHAAPA
jgi:hypothetical protein